MGILASAFFFLVIGIIAAGNGDFSVLAAIGKGIARHCIYSVCFVADGYAPVWISCIDSRIDYICSDMQSIEMRSGS